MRIVQCCAYTPPARDAMGAERMVERIAQGMIARGHQVSFLVNRDAKEAPVAGAELTTTTRDADIVHFHGWEPDEYSQQTKSPWVTTIHAYSLHQEEKRAYRLRNIVAVSKFAARNIGARQFVWNCSDGNEFKFKQQKDDYFLWMAGTDWGESKGLFTTIDVINKLRLKLKIAGSGKDKEQIERIRKLCNERIEYLGSVNGQEKVELLQNAKALCLFTRVPDACPVSVSEALMCGTPVLSSCNGAMPEIVLNNVTGFNCGSLHETIRAFKTVERISPKTCRDYAEKFFSIDKCATQYEKIYHRVIDYAREPKEDIHAKESNHSTA